MIDAHVVDNVIYGALMDTAGGIGTVVFPLLTITLFPKMS